MMTTRMSRRTGLIALAGAVAGTALPRVAQAQAQPGTLRVGLVPIWDVGPYYAAQAQGYFAAENLTVTPQIVRGGAVGIPAMLSGSLDIVYSNGTSIVQAISSGIDLRVILEGTPVGATPPDPGALLKRKGDPFKTGKDMEGKVIGVNVLGDVQWMFVTAWIKATGGDPAKVKIIELAFPEMIAALKQGRVDSVLALDPFMTIGFGDPGIELLDWILSRVYANGPVAFYAVTPEFAQTRANDVRAYIRAYRRGAAWLNANQGKDAFYNLIAGFTSMNADLIRKMTQIPAHADIDRNTLPRLTALMAQTGLLKSPVDLRTKIFA
jgi:NitT/TauT family transport system substrate-binding protein